MLTNKFAVSLCSALLLASSLTKCPVSMSSEQKNGVHHGTKTESLTIDMKKDVIKQIRKFVGDEGANGQKAWERLSSYPRQELTDFLLITQTETAETDPLRIDIAFVLCNLDYEYRRNREVITDAFVKSGSNADAEERLISRLIRRGDKELLPYLFSAVERADGGFSEGLADTFAEQMLNTPDSFLLKLKTEPVGTRQKVYALFDESAVSADDIKKIKKYLASISQDSPVAEVAKEMLASLRARHIRVGGGNDDDGRQL